MSTFPVAPRGALLQWCRTHAEIFAMHAAAIGLAPEQAADYQQLAAAAAAAVAAQDVARQNALTATQAAAQALAALRQRTANLLRLVRGHAELSAAPDMIYDLAQIDPPAAPAPLPPPAAPTALRVQLDAGSGALTLRWKARNPANAAGTSYVVRRRSVSAAGRRAGDDAGDWEIVALTGAKRCVDATLPAGTQTVQYTVQGQRAALAGAVSEILTVHFGRLSGPDGHGPRSAARALVGV